VHTTSYELTRCLVCGSPESEEIAGSDEVRDEVESLWAFHGRRLRPNTPSARLMDRVAFSERPPWRVVRCLTCGFVYRNPIERAQELRDLYAGESPSPDVMLALHETQRAAYREQASRLLKVLGRRGSGLEVGSYVGAFLAAAREAGLNVEGLDVNADVNAFARRLGFTVHDGSLEGNTLDRTFDTVSIWNCFDQLPDPRAAANAAWSLLRPGGILAIRVPNGDFYARRSLWLRRSGARRALARTMLAHNNLLTFPYRYGFTAPSITRLLGRTGFVVRAMYGDVLVPIADEWTRTWASLEERIVKRALATMAHRTLSWAPWMEVYAERTTGQEGGR